MRGEKGDRFIERGREVQIQGEKIQRIMVEREKEKACLTLASCSTELQFDTRTSAVSEHVSWVK